MLSTLCCHDMQVEIKESFICNEGRIAYVRVAGKDCSISISLSVSLIPLALTGLQLRGRWFFFLSPRPLILFRRINVLFYSSPSSCCHYCVFPLYFSLNFSLIFPHFYCYFIIFILFFHVHCIFFLFLSFFVVNI